MLLEQRDFERIAAALEQRAPLEIEREGGGTALLIRVEAVGYPWDVGAVAACRMKTERFLTMQNCKSVDEIKNFLKE